MSLRQKHVLLLVITSLQLFASCYAECTVDVNTGGMPSPQPLILLPNSTGEFSGFVQPNADGQVLLQAGEQLLLACPGSSMKLFTAVQTATVSCIQDTVFSWQNVSYTLNAFACADLPQASANISTSGDTTCSSGYVKYDVGFTVNSTLYKVYDVCFDGEKLNPAFSHATLVKNIAGFQYSTNTRSQWQDAGLYGGIDVDNQYSTQTETLNQLLGASNSYVKGTNFLSRGHLTARADFALAVLQTATYLYPNSAPQWYHFNSGNWNQLELDVRAFVQTLGRDLDVYTGTYGVLALANTSGVQTDVYLFANQSTSLLPVPKLFWKIVYDSADQAAMVFVGVNNPFVDAANLTDDYRVCPDVCSRVNWLRWKPTNATAGLAYCCEYSEFLKTVTYAPQITVQKTFSSSPASRAAPAGLFAFLAALFLLATQFA